MYKLEYISDSGQRILLHCMTEDVVVSKIKGLDGVDSDFYETQGVNQDGTSVQKVSIQAQPVVISGEILGKVEPLRQRFYKTFAPKSGGFLYYDEKYKKRVEVKQSPIISSHCTYGFYQVILHAPYPYWITTDDIRIDLVGLEAMFKFPINYSDPETHMFGKRTAGEFKVVENLGHVPAKWKLILVAKGVVINPSITKVPMYDATALPETVKIGNPSYTMQPGERIYIDTTKKSISVTSDKNGIITDIFGALDLDSERFLLDLGENIIRFDADSNKEALYPLLMPEYAFSGPARKDGYC